MLKGRDTIKNVMLIVEKLTALLLAAIFFGGIYPSLPPKVETINAINSGVRVTDISPEPIHVAVLLFTVFVPSVLILQWWRSNLRIIGWGIFALLIVSFFVLAAK